MRDFVLALIAHNSYVGQTERNLDATRGWAAKAKKRGAQLVGFPELNLTGHGGDPVMIRAAEPIPTGPTTQAVHQLARELDLYLSVGLAELDGSVVYNTQILVGPNGVISKQRKLHLSNDEYFYFRHGSTLHVADLPFARVGQVICYDNEHPEPARCLAVAGAEVILSPHAARFGKWESNVAKRRAIVQRAKNHYKRVHACRALDNSVYVGVVNAAGPAAEHLKGVNANHAGGALVFDPMGDLVAESRSKDVQEEMLVVPLSAARMREKRERSCLPLRTRRVEAYGILAQPTD